MLVLEVSSLGTFRLIPPVVGIGILDDIIPEPPEEILLGLALGPVENSRGRVVLSPNTTNVIIQDNDENPRIQIIGPSSVSVYEAVRLFPVCVEILDPPIVTVATTIEAGDEDKFIHAKGMFDSVSMGQATWGWSESRLF